MRPDLRHTLLLVLAAGLFGAGCRQDMHDQPKYEPLEASSFFPDGKSSRMVIDGTVARGSLVDDPVLLTGITEDDRFAPDLPVELTPELLARGRNRYEAFCSACHGRAGNGQGMVVQRGFKHPKSFHEERLRLSDVGYFFNVMTNGFGEMSSYAVQLSAQDRWAVAAYIRALQLSQSAPASELDAEDLAQIHSGATPAAATDGHEAGAHGE